MTPVADTRARKWSRFLQDIQDYASAPQPLEAVGTLLRVTGLVLEAAGVRVPVGSICEIRQPGQPPVLAEVVGFNGDRAFLMPTGDLHGLASGARVIPRPAPRVPPRFGVENHPWRRSEDRGLHLPMGDGLLGRVVDSHGHPMDRGGPIADAHAQPMIRRPINAMDRDPVRRALDTGVRSINALLTVGRGQRLGLFAGTGVGKSVLLGMMARYTAADVIVVGLIGERGREVKEFIEDILGEDGLRRSVVVAAPADAPPLVRMQGASYATAIAEHFRDRGQHVLLLMDSLTRYAMAQREIALAIGEPPATKGYPPSVFAKLPQLVERSGNGLNGVGSITAFYTVLTEGDDPQDPIADAARGILDGHIVLSRELAESGHYPAIDVERSVSRVMSSVAPKEHLLAARKLRQLLAKYNKARDLIQLGAYAPGHDAELDTAVRLHGQIVALLQQDMRERADLESSRQELLHLVGT
ncbi:MULTISPECIES: flagellar protein export ATPase FliI [Rubrivivax]|uniref:Flagellum-specific ATP synthase n=1 Tax=Rubrivivax benzoatilyticus TaxID=316997 RepID=A0ABX0I2W0_9BURK|nr:MULTISPECIES: flagellar protein export ATPase FliI [Rubrivivax]EGJ11370.1 flagellar protein export ATPase FliI [Rubrivivax benzoatilyticus JA2 = ATCC BAA-35]NHK99924.1 flagellar protein export ATPase FliI [Rubrivivax benzoatilyticus]NHL25797.1 flagellar protein export ATPase FliI [Rubrivivax benzoatilyticus]